MEHPFFYKIKWDDIKERKTSPPWIPSLMNHFNQSLTKIPILQNEIGEGGSPLKRLNSRTSLYFEHSNNIQTPKVVCHFILITITKFLPLSNPITSYFW